LIGKAFIRLITNEIDKKTIVALREEIFKKVNGKKGFNNISLAEYNLV